MESFLNLFLTGLGAGVVADGLVFRFLKLPGILLPGRVPCLALLDWGTMPEGAAFGLPTGPETPDLGFRLTWPLRLDLITHWGATNPGFWFVEPGLTTVVVGALRTSTLSLEATNSDSASIWVFRLSMTE